MSKLYVGIGHKARQGKDTLATMIHATYPNMTRVIGFADALKVDCRVNRGMREKDPVLLQQVATEHRDANPDKWIEVLEMTANDYPQPIILIPDLRFKNEAAFIEAHDGLTVRVRRLMPDGSVFVTQDRDPKHESEIDLDEYGWHVTIDAADGDIDHLEREAQRLGAAILVGYDQKRRADAERERRIHVVRA